MKLLPGRRWSLALIFLVLANAACSSLPTQKPSPSKKSEVPAEEVSATPESAILNTLARLRSSGIDPEFLSLIQKKYQAPARAQIDEALKILEPNLFGFLYHGDYFAHDTSHARDKIERYLRNHRTSFKRAERAHGVSARSIAALLWVETKLGSHTGSHPLPLVFFSLALGAEPSVCAILEARLPAKHADSRLPEKPDLASSVQKLRDRCLSKALWATEELKVLAMLHQTRVFDAFTVKGSFAGAFGIPQFIPSSYLRFAASEYRKRPNLFMDSDAIFSVGNFLKKNGWKNGVSDAEIQALYSYNRSRDYGAVIRKISQELKRTKTQITLENSD